MRVLSCIVPTTHLRHSQEECNSWRLIGGGYGIHWEEIDEDISVEGLLAGKPSSESQISLKKRLEKQEKATFDAT